MKSSSSVTAILVVGFMMCALMPSARADWHVGDPYKMHFPQLPNPMGWDVEISSYNPQHECADDWLCTESGSVGDIHFWYSVSGDAPTDIHHIVATIYGDDNPTAGVPGSALWTQQFDVGDFSVISPYGSGQQGFADPQYPDTWQSGMNDHSLYHQINITGIEDPFYQEAGTTYWLGLYVWWDNAPQEPVGWKTSADLWGNPAVFRSLQTGDWLSLDVANGAPERLDFAFVITPEPSALLMLIPGMGLFAAIFWRRRRRPA